MPTLTRSPALSRLQIVAAAFLFSTGGAAIKSCGLTGWQVASFRCGVAALAMWAMLKPARGRWSPGVMLVGAAYAATLILYALANKATTAAHAIFLQSAAPLYVLLLAPVLLGERIRRRDVALMAAMAAGVLMCVLGQQTATETAPDPARGNLLAAAAGLSWALTVMGLRWIGRPGPGGGHAAVAVVAGNCLGFLVCLPFALPVAASRPGDWLWVLYLGVFQVAFAYVLLTDAVKSVGAFEVALLLLIEPVFNPIWAWWAHGEVPGEWALAGGATVLLVTAAKTWLDAARA